MDDTQRTVAFVLWQIGGWGTDRPQTGEEWLALAEKVAAMEADDDWCPMCGESICLEGCSLEGQRVC